MKRLLILGSLGEFTELVKKAKKRNIYTVVLDGNPDGPARKYADESYLMDVRDIEGIAKLCIDKKIDRIITSFSDLLMECMVKIADKAGIPSYLKVDQLPFYRDKLTERETLKSIGCDSLKFMEIKKEDLRDISLVEDKIKDFRFPLISKPIDSYGSRGIKVSENMKDLKSFIGESFKSTSLDKIILEEYNDGYEFNLISWIVDGEIYIISIADREKTKVLENTIPLSSRNVYPSCMISNVYTEALNILKKYIKKTGQKNGPLCMQFFYKEGEGVSVCEIAARIFGYEHDLTEYVYGLDLEELLLDLCFNENVIEEKLKKHDIRKPLRHGAVVYFQGEKGVISDMKGARELFFEEHLIKPWLFYKEGDDINTPSREPYLALYYIAADTREELDHVSKLYINKFSFKDRDGNILNFKNEIPKYHI